MTKESEWHLGARTVLGHHDAPIHDGCASFILLVGEVPRRAEKCEEIRGACGNRGLMDAPFCVREPPFRFQMFHFLGGFA